MTKIRLNGTVKEVTAPTVTELVKELGLPAATLLIEHNGVALHRSEWEKTMLQTNDQIEILRVAAGG